MTNTPRTDSKTWETITGAYKCNNGDGGYVKADFARTLEREITELQHRNDTQARTIAEFGDTPKKYAEMMKERDEWREMTGELAFTVNRFLDPEWNIETRIEKHRKLLELLKQFNALKEKGMV